MAQPAMAWSPATRGSRLRVDVQEVLKDSKGALQEVLKATPGWDQEAARQASVDQISGAMTNLVYLARSRAASANTTVIVRVFGQGGKLFSQKDERNIFLLAAQMGIGPKCLVEYENGRVEEFLPGDNLTCDTMRQPDISAAIAHAMASFHVRMLAKLPPPSVAAQQAAAAAADAGENGAASSMEGQQDGAGAAEAGAATALRPAIYERIRSWYAAAAEVCTAEELENVGLTNLLDELDAIEGRLGQLFPPWVGFCHNDLQYGNMLLFTSSSGSGGSEGGAADQDSAAPLSPRGVLADGASTAAAAAAADDGGLASRAATADAEAYQDGTAVTAAEGKGANSSGGGAVVVKLIDYEYSTSNDVAYDVANHFCEWAYNYHSDEAHVFQSDRVPTQDQQLHFCRAYAEAMVQQAEEAAGSRPAKRRAVETASGQVEAAPEASAAANGGSSGDSGKGLAATILATSVAAAAGAADERSVGAGTGAAEAGPAAEPVAQLLLQKAQAHMPLVHLKWGLWGLIQDKLSDVDFDYLSYGKQRIELYHSTKQPLLQQQQQQQQQQQ